MVKEAWFKYCGENDRRENFDHIVHSEDDRLQASPIRGHDSDDHSLRMPLLTPYKRPSEIIGLDSLPAASAGKILKYRLTEAARDRAVDRV